MKKILVPCDFSNPSKEAFKMAVDLASKSNGTITVLYVIYTSAVYDPNFIGEPMAFSQQYFEASQEDAKKAFAELKKSHGKNLDITLEIEFGGLLESITQVIENKKIDLVVMGTTGSSGIAEILIGSNTEKAVRFSKVPVLAVHQATHANAIKNILLPTAGSLDQTEFISRVKELQAFLKAKLHLLLINTPGNFTRDADGKEALEEFVKHYRLDNYELHFKSYRKEEDGIIDFSNSNKIDLIVMGTHARKGLAHLFTGSITENVVNHIQCPIWTCRLKASNSK